MDRLIVERKLDSLQRCLERAQSKTPKEIADLLHDLDLQDVLELNWKFRWLPAQSTLPIAASGSGSSHPPA